MINLKNISQEELKLSHITLANTPDAVFWIDYQGKLNRVNKITSEWLRYPEQELLSLRIFDIAPQLDQEKWMQIKHIIKNDGTYIFETQLQPKPGAMIPVEVTASYIEFNKNQYVCFFAHDLSIYKQTESALRASEARLRAIAQALPDFISVLDEEGRYLEVLTSEENLFSHSTAELKGQRIHDFFPKLLADKFLNLIKETIKTKKRAVIEYNPVISGVYRCFEARIAPIQQALVCNQCIVWIVRDITDRKLAEELQHQKVYLQEELQNELYMGEIIGFSGVMKKVFQNIEIVASTDSTVLISGETGTGKELIARAIHKSSPRKDSVLVKVNCGAIPAGLVESELFGHEKGAFTGATVQKKGKFELAHNGTLFLDEVGELPYDTQVKLLRVLQEQEFERVGGTEVLKVNVRVIAATNMDLRAEVQKGSFRSDLFYRLDIFPIEVPPLRNREEDIPYLVNYLAQKFSMRMGKKITSVSPMVMEKLKSYDWPGNVRELANILERAVILCQGSVLELQHISSLHIAESQPDKFLTMEEAERRHILKALKKTGGVLAGPAGAANLLGINRSTLWSRMRKLGIHSSK